MHFALRTVGLAFICIGAVYIMTPADQLPTLLPGYDAGVASIRANHGLVSAGLGLALALAGWWIGPK